MTNLMKPSELPIDTTIEDKTEGYWTKQSDMRWEPHIFHCVDCLEDSVINDASADVEFTDFRIVSVPWQVAWELALKLQDEYGTVDCEGEDITVEGLVKDALAETTDIQHEEWEKQQRALKLWDEA